MPKPATFKLPYRVILTAIAWTGFLASIVSRSPGVSIGQELVRSSSYFTIQTNILVAVWLTVAVFYRNSENTHPLLQPRIRGALTVYITVTCLVYAILLAPLWEPTGLHLFATTITHYVTPLAFILDWLLFEKRQTYQWRYALYWLAYPLAYLIFSQIRGALTGSYLYPFLDRSSLGWDGLAQNTAGLVVFFVVLSGIYIGINQLWRTSAIR